MYLLLPRCTSAPFSLFALTHARNACVISSANDRRAALYDHARKKSLINLPVAACVFFREIYPTDKGLLGHGENRTIYLTIFLHGE